MGCRRNELGTFTKLCLLICLMGVVSPIYVYGHAFYVSTCLITHKPEIQQINVRMNLFPDDLELALAGIGAPPLGLTTPQPSQSAGPWIAAYLEKKFGVSVNGKKLPLWLENWEKSEEVIKVELAYEDVCDIQTVTVRNEVLIEIYDEQANIVTLKIGEEKKVLNLNKVVGEGRLTQE